MWTAPLGAAIVALREGRCALAITAADIPDPRIELEALSFVPRAAVAAASAPPCRPLQQRGAASRRPSWRTISRSWSRTRLALTEGRDFGVLSPGTWRVSDNETKRALILAGVGWGSLPLWLIERDLADGRLVRDRRRGVRPATAKRSRAPVSRTARTNLWAPPRGRSDRRCCAGSRHGRQIRPRPAPAARRTCPGHRLEPCSDLAYGPVRERWKKALPAAGSNTAAPMPSATGSAAGSMSPSSWARSCRRTSWSATTR